MADVQATLLRGISNAFLVVRKWILLSLIFAIISDLARVAAEYGFDYPKSSSEVDCLRGGDNQVCLLQSVEYEFFLRPSTTFFCFDF